MKKLLPLLKNKFFITFIFFTGYLIFLDDNDIFYILKQKETLNQLKEQNNIIPIGEFNKKIAEVLQNEDGNFIYERLGERYANYFIDEFQDTS